MISDVMMHSLFGPARLTRATDLEPGGGGGTGESTTVPRSRDGKRVWRQDLAVRLSTRGMARRDSLRVLFLVSAHNGLSQRAWIALTELGHEVAVAVVESPA